MGTLTLNGGNSWPITDGHQSVTLSAPIYGGQCSKHKVHKNIYILSERVVFSYFNIHIYNLNT